MRIFILAIVIFSCQSAPADKTADDAIEQAIAKGDTAEAKKLAQEELNKMRSSITDSSFALIMDVNLQIQKIEFYFEKSRGIQNVADEKIVNQPEGIRLYELMMRAYKLAIETTTRESDVVLYTKAGSVDQQQWFQANFSGKPNDRARKSLMLLQNDMYIISAIVNHGDTDELRKQAEDQYKRIID